MLQVYIEGPDATEQGHELLKQTKLSGNVSTPKGVKSFDAVSAVEVLDVVKAGAEAATAIIAMAAAIWKWRQEAKKANKVVLEKKKEEGESERLLVDDDTKQEAIEAFLKV